MTNPEVQASAVCIVERSGFRRDYFSNLGDESIVKGGTH